MSEEVRVGEVTPLRYFGRDLVAYRGESGEAHVVDAYCPHLGANLAYGGTVEGDCIRCPFHGWRFDGAGRCVDVPYSERVPPKAKLEAYPVQELDGVIFVYYSPVPGEAAADWSLTTIAGEAWTPGKLIHWRNLASHPQEVAENTVDTAHIAPVHDGRGARVIGGPVRDGARMVIDLEFEAPGEVVDMPNEYNDVHLHVTLNGLGDLVVRTHVRNVDVHAIQRIYVTPVDESHIDIRGIIHVRPTDDPEFTQELADVFYRAYVVDFARDFPIWENKRYLTRPVLAKGDGPVGLYRRWCTQFYDEDPLAQDQEDEQAAPSQPATQRAQPAPEPAQPLLRRLSLRVFGRLSRSNQAPGASDARHHQNNGVEDGDDDWQSDEGGPRSAPAAAPSNGDSSNGGGGARVENAKEYYETLHQRFVPTAARGVDAVFQWELGGEEGRTFHAVVRDGLLEVHDGAHADPTVTLAMDARDYVEVVNGDLDGMRAFTSGRGKVKGSVRAAMKMRNLFPGA
ncbi:MAG: Rieske 2Fe-2S domain-containing protein [Myxococcales bacterium]|nr:Rieske 2Fe-2S domain-containing protein [Myxococcales bacterium]